MGGAASTVGSPDRAETCATRLCLVPRDDPRAIVFGAIPEGRQAQAAPLFIGDGKAIVARHHRVRSVMGFRYIELGIGAAENALRARREGPFVVHESGLVFDVAWGKLEAENVVSLVRSGTLQPLPTKWHVPGRKFSLHNDGKLGPSAAPHLVLGAALPSVHLVKPGAANALRLTAEAAQGVRSASGAPLTLASHPGLALVDAAPVTRRIGEWRYRVLSVGPAERAIVGRQKGAFVERQDHGLVLDVAFWKMHEGNHVNFVGGQYPGRTFLNGPGRRFRVTPTGELQCSGDMVLGVSTGATLQPEEVPMAVPVAVAATVGPPPAYDYFGDEAVHMKGLGAGKAVL